MLNHKKNLNNEGGFILVVTMLILVVLTLIGISATRTTNIELQVAGNEKWSQEAFYKADGATEAAVNMIEENLSCPSGFSGSINDSDEDTFLQVIGVEVADLKFAYDEVPADVPQNGFSGTPTANDYSTDDVRSLRIPNDPANPNDTDNHGNLTVFGPTRIAAGNAIQMAAGYEGKGFGTAGGGAYIDENIYARHYGRANSETMLEIGWKHIVGQEGVCRY